MSNIITARDIEMVTSDIRYAQRQGARQLLSNMIEIGRLLVEAKSMVPYGEWGKYLQEQLDYRQSTANNLMKLYQEYGDNQESFFGSLQNSQAFGNLSYTQALALMVLPAEERAEFVEKNNVAEMSTRQLEQAIKERNEAIQKRDENLREYQRLAEENERITAGMVEAADKLEDLQEKERQAREEAKAAQEKITELQGKLAKARENEKNAKTALKTAKEKPEIPEAMMESLRAEVAADAAKKAAEDLQKQLDALTKEKADAEQVAVAAKEKLEAAQKQLALASPGAAVFKAMFEQVQQDFKKLTDALVAVKQEDPNTAAKLQGAVKALLEKMQSDLEG